MAKLFDEQGNEVDGAFSKEEHEAAVKAAEEAATKAATDAAAAAAAQNQDDKGKNDDKKDDDADMPAWAKAMRDDVAAMKNNQTTASADQKNTFAKKFAGDKEDDQKRFTDMFDQLGSFPATAEGQQQRAEAAARAAGFEVKVVDVGAVSGAGGRSLDAEGKPVATESEKAVGKVLNISDADREKYAAKADTLMKEAGYNT